jgi:hypothetical protein
VLGWSISYLDIVVHPAPESTVRQKICDCPAAMLDRNPVAPLANPRQ